jgi:peptidoglycan/LPS O-acetylase OafA/YrhL
MRERDFYIDCLRSVMIALVILHHTAITYGASDGWFYYRGTTSSTLKPRFASGRRSGVAECFTS